MTPRTVSAALALALAALVPCAAAAQSGTAPPVDRPFVRRLPIAVAAFQGDAQAAAQASEATTVVRGDLALSGLFDVLDPKSFLADPAEGLAPTTVAFTRWADVGAEILVKARLRAGTSGLEGELHLYEVRAGREVVNVPVRAAGARAMGHRIADEIVRYCTRQPGAFSTRIAAIRKTPSRYELVLFDVDGQEPQVLLSEADILQFPAWKPDGSEILLTSYRTGRPQLWALRLSDRTFRPVGSRPNAYGGVYSPDGSRIAYVVTENGDSHIFVMNADGSGARRVTSGSALDVSPAWSPDGRRVVFTSSRAGTPQLYVMSVDGSDLRRITFQGNYNQTPVWSPRGDAIVFTARDELRMFDLFSVAPETTRITRVTQDQGRTNEDPSWAPNGMMIVFRTDRNGVGQLVVSDPLGNRQTVIAGARGSDLFQPAWGPFAQ